MVDRKQMKPVQMLVGSFRALKKHNRTQQQKNKKKMGGKYSSTENNGIFASCLAEINILSMALGIILMIDSCFLRECFCPAVVQNSLSTCCCHHAGQKPPVVHPRPHTALLLISHFATWETAELPSAPQYFG